MGLVELIGFIERGKDVLVREIPSLGANFYSETRVLDNQDMEKSNFALVVSGSSEGSNQAVHLNVFSKDQRATNFIEGIIAGTEEWFGETGKRQYVTQGGYSASFEGHKATINYTQQEPFDNEMYCAQVISMLDWLVDILKYAQETAQQPVQQPARQAVQQPAAVAEPKKAGITPESLYQRIVNFKIDLGGKEYKCYISVTDGPEAGTRALILGAPEVKNPDMGLVNLFASKYIQDPRYSVETTNGVAIMGTFKPRPQNQDIITAEKYLRTLLDVLGNPEKYRK